MFSTRKFVPWRNWNEWRDLYTLLYSENKDSVIQGTAKVSALASKGPIPTAIEVTASIQKNLFVEKSAMGLSLSIIRFINGVVEPFKNINQNSPISTIGSQLGIPEYIVAIRHSATHGKLPSFEFATLAALQALQWLKENYWIPQLNQLFQIENDFKNAYIDYIIKDEEPFEFMQQDLILSFGIDVLVHQIMLNSNQSRETIGIPLMQKVAKLIEEKSRIMINFPSAVGVKLAEEMCKGNGLASIWLEFLIKKGLAPSKSIAMLVKLADQKLLKKSLPDPVLQLLPDISRSSSCTNLAALSSGIPRWPPTSIGNLPICDDSVLTILPSEFEYAEDIEEDENNDAKTVLEENKIEEEEEKIDENKKEEDSSDSDAIEIW